MPDEIMKGAAKKALRMRGNMVDVGKVEKERLQEAPSKDKKWYPSVSLSVKELPALEGLKMGKVLNMVVEAEVKGKRQNDDEPITYNLEIKKIALVEGGDNSQEEKESEEKEI